MPGTGFFQLGDLLVLALVAVGFFLYNRFDRNSKTLEKVRKYADKVRAELDKIIGDKKVEIQELTINLDVEEKKNREILGRFLTARENVLKQAENLEQYQVRVQEYNARLTELQGMTGKIDENLARLHQESAYVDQVGQRLNEIQKKEGDLVKGLNAINAAFQEQNRGKLEELTAGFTARFEKETAAYRVEITRLTADVAKFRTGVEELVAARDKVSADRIKDYTKSLDQVEVQYKTRLKAAADRGLALEDETFDGLKKLIDQKYTGLEENWKGGMSKLRDEVLSLVDDIKGKMNENRTSFESFYQKSEVRMESLADRLEQADREIADQSDRLVDQQRAALAGYEQESRNAMDKIRSEQEEIRRARREFEDQMGDFRDSLNRDLAAMEETLTVEVMKGAESRQKQYESVIKANFNRIEGMLGDFSALEKSLKKGLDDTASRLKIDFDRYRRMLEEDMDRIRGEAETSADNIRQQCESMDKLKAEFVKALDLQRAGMEKDLSSKMETVREKVEKEWAGFGEKLAREREEERARAAAELAHISRMSSELNDQVDALKKNTHEAVAARLAGFEKELTADLETREKTLSQKFAGFQSGQEKLRSDLETQFTKTLEERLAARQKHVDDVLSTLEERSTRLSAALENWKKGLETEITEISETREKERLQLEHRYTTQLDEKLRKINDEVNRNLDDLRTRTRDTHESVTREVSGSEQEIEKSRNDIRLQVAALKKETKENLVKVEQELKSVQKVRSDYQKGLEDIKLVMDKKLDEMDKDIEKQIHSISGKVQTKAESLELKVLKETESRQKSFQKTVADRFQKLERLFADMDAMETSVEGSLGDMQARVREITERETRNTEVRFSGFREEMDKIEDILVRMKAKSIDNLKDEITGFEKQMRAEILGREGALKEEIGTISGHVLENLDRTLDGKTKTTIDKFQSEFENHRMQMQKFVSQVEFDYDRISSGIAGIEHKQKEYLVQTKLFERTDQLKDQLGRDLAKLEQLTLKVSGDSQSLGEVKDQLDTVMAEYKDASERINRFFSEKQKIDLMENKIDRIVQLSESVDQKLGRLSDLNDTLQGYQVRLKQMEDFHIEIGNRYERLERKLPVIDTTTDGIDRTFSTLEALQQQVKTALEEMKGIPEHLAKLEERNNNLFLEGDRLNLLLNRVGTLDNDLQSVETRIQEMEKTREWLAKMETRMEALNKEVQDKVRLMGNLTAKETGTSRTANRGAPDMDTREMVVKLAREGWKTEEIARTAKLGQGEVELILEMSQRRK
jgi:chromosome segregation ATPase